jgi:DNA-binding NtrC family response regulator
MSKNGSLIAPEILIVDDEEDIRDLIAGILHDEGFETRVAADSDSAIAACARAGRSLWCSTSGCRAAGSTASRCWTC